MRLFQEWKDPLHSTEKGPSGSLALFSEWELNAKIIPRKHEESWENKGRDTPCQGEAEPMQYVPYECHTYLESWEQPDFETGCFKIESWAEIEI